MMAGCVFMAGGAALGAIPGGIYGGNGNTLLLPSCATRQKELLFSKW